MPIPTYTALEPLTREWACDRGLIRADGTPHKATPMGQYAKTVEEVGEAAAALESWTMARSIDPALARNLALEFGDILVTLCLQSAMHGTTLEQCLSSAGRITAPVQTWQYVGVHNSGLGVAIEHYSQRISGFIGAVARCVEDEARIQLAMTGPECLALALDKIRDRAGEVVDGQFVKK